jgi:hypothetical protein
MYRVGLYQTNRGDVMYEVLNNNGMGAYVIPPVDTGIPVGGNIVVHFDFQITGTSPTTFRMKAWTGNNQPDGWPEVGTDNAPGSQVVGQIAVLMHANGVTLTNIFNSFTVTGS